MAVDITINETIDLVDITVNPNIIEVNVTRTSGGGAGSQTLAQTLVIGKHTGGNNIIVDDADAIELENTSLLKKGNYDFGGAGGISRICSVGYEDMWQAGIHHVFDNNGFIRHSTNCFNYIPDISYDSSLRFKIGSLWTLDDGTTYVCTDVSVGAAVWEIYHSNIPSLSEVVNVGNLEFVKVLFSECTLGTFDYNITYKNKFIWFYDDIGGSQVLQLDIPSNGVFGDNLQFMFSSKDDTAMIEVYQDGAYNATLNSVDRYRYNFIQILEGTNLSNWSITFESSGATTLAYTLDQVLTNGNSSSQNMYFYWGDYNLIVDGYEISLNKSYLDGSYSWVRMTGDGIINIKTGGTTGQVSISSMSNNNYLASLPEKHSGSSEIFAMMSDIPAAQIQSDWNQTNNTLLDYIKNKPTVGTGDMTKAVYDVDNSGIVDNAEAIIIIGRNSTGSTLRKGTIIYISGSTGNRPNFVKAQANTEATSAGTFGVIVNDIANNADGNCCVLGYLDTLDTRSTATYPFTSDTLADGDTIYLSPTTAGYITNVKPSAPNHLVYLGKVTRTSPTNGTIIYRIQNGYELNEIHDVAITSVADKQLLSYDSATSLWKNKSVTTADIAASTNKNYVTDAQQTVIGNTSGTNSGDETTSTIKTKLGITTLSGSNTGDQDLSTYAILANTPAVILNDNRTSSAVTGTTTTTILNSYLAPANTFAAFDRLQLDFLGLKTTTLGAGTYTVNINTTNSLSGSTKIAGFTISAASKFLLGQRHLAFKSATTFEIFTTGLNNAYDIGTDTNLPTTITYDTTQAYYIITTITPALTTDSFTQSRFAITRSKSKNSI